MMRLQKSTIFYISHSTDKTRTRHFRALFSCHFYISHSTDKTHITY